MMGRRKMNVAFAWSRWGHLRLLECFLVFINYMHSVLSLGFTQAYKVAVRNVDDRQT
jgi:hypothetical protein